MIIYIKSVSLRQKSKQLYETIFDLSLNQFEIFQLIVSMKKIIFSLLLLVMAVTFSQAQTKVDLGFKLNPTFGWFNNVTGTGVKSDGMRFGYSYGVIADIYLKENYAIGTELAISNICGRLNSTVDAVTTSQKIRLTYIDIPITLKLKTNEVSMPFPVKYYGQFGLTPGFKIGGKVKYGDESHSIGSDVQLVRYGLLIGGGIEYNLVDNTRMVVGLTYNNGLNNVFKSKYQASAKLSYIALNLGILF